MCGLPLKTENNDVYVYIRPADEDAGGIFPEAQILLRGVQLELAEEIPFHRGCRGFRIERNDCIAD